MKENLVSLTKTLIKYQTTKENLEEKEKIVDFCFNELKKFSQYIKIFRSQNLPSLVANLKKEKNPKVFLVGHLDVVPAKKEEFLPKIKGDRLYGRGSFDMKGACAVMIELFKYFAKKEKKPSLGIILTTDEEIGGENGVGYLLKKERFKSKLAVVLDGGGAPWKVVLKEKGVLHLEIETKGKSAHGAYPFKGDNAIDHLIRIYLKIRKFIPELKKKEWKTSMNLGKIEGGDAPNKVPDRAKMYLDIRYVKKDEWKKILEKIKEVAKKEKGKLKILSFGYPLIVEKNASYIKLYREIVKKILKKKIKFERMCGATDGRFFYQKGIPVLMTQPYGKNLHAENEWVSIKSLFDLYEVLRVFLEKIFEKI